MISLPKTLSRTSQKSTAAESGSKVHEPKLYKEVVNNPIYCQQWRGAIEYELDNLVDHNLRVQKIASRQKANRIEIGRRPGLWHKVFCGARR